MSHGDKRRGRGHRGDRPQRDRGDKREEPAPVLDESSVIIQQFMAVQKRLDAKHDKHERLVKMSRDVTIESKRTIFLLQRLTGREVERDSILSEAGTKLQEIQAKKWRPICDELQGEDPYQFIRAYSPGLQEYIEALSFYHYLQHGELISLHDVEQTLVFPLAEQVPDQMETDISCDNIEQSSKYLIETPPTHTAVNDSQSQMCVGSHDDISVHIPPMEYMLGIGDLTGELMRVAIHSVGSGDLSKPFKLCNFLRNIYDSFLLFGKVSRELNRKLFTLKQSLQKVEAACYTLQVRGSEIPKHMLAEVLNSVTTGPSDMGDLDDM